MTELAFVYVDLGDDRYKVMVAEMVASARRVMPDVKITQISDNKTPMYPEVDGFYQADMDCPAESVTYFKGHFFADFAMKCGNPLILCDVDMIWQKALDVCGVIDESHLGILYRTNMPAMPFNAGMILSKPTSKYLWSQYQEVLDDLHANNMGGWYCDQIAAAIAWSRQEFVASLGMEVFAYAPTGPHDDGGKEAYALHFKGNRKQWLPQFLARAA